MSDKKNQTNFEINQVINQPYKYGFTTKISNEKFPSGISEEIVSLISEKKEEPDFLKNFRLKAYKKWKTMEFPTWANLKVNQIDYNAITYYSVPKQKKQLNFLKINLKFG